MFNACKVLEQVEAIGSRLAKEKLLRDNKDNAELKALLDIALNPLKTYGVSEIDSATTSAREAATLQEVLSTAESLSKRQVTGNAARDALALLVNVENPIERKWLIRAFSKDLRAGISVKTVNKIWPKLTPEFEIGLCGKVGNVDTDIDWSEEWIIEPKYDGIRALAFWDGEAVTFVSRNNKPMYNLRLIEDDISSLLKGIDKCVLDGELHAGNWNDTISLVHSKKVRDVWRLSYFVFDILAMDDFKNKTSKPLVERKALLSELNAVIRERLINLVETKVSVVRYKEINKRLWRDEYCSNLILGYEGSVLKRLGSKYPFGRSKDWIKVKPVDTFDVVVIGYEEGTGRNVGKLGAFICNMDGVKLNVGGGYTDEQRVEYWKDRENWIGKVIEVEGQEKTKDGKIRFPQFVRKRDDR